MYFKEFEAFTGAQASLFVLGVLVVLAGVILLSWNPADSLQRYDPMKAELPLAHGVPDAPPEVCRTRDLQEGGFDWVDLEDGEGGDGHGAVTNPMASASVGLPRDWRSLRINEVRDGPIATLRHGLWLWLPSSSCLRTRGDAVEPSQSARIRVCQRRIQQQSGSSEPRLAGGGPTGAGARRRPKTLVRPTRSSMCETCRTIKEPGRLVRKAVAAKVFEELCFGKVRARCPLTLFW